MANEAPSAANVKGRRVDPSRKQRIVSCHWVPDLSRIYLHNRTQVLSLKGSPPTFRLGQRGVGAADKTERDQELGTCGDQGLRRRHMQGSMWIIPLGLGDNRAKLGKDNRRRHAKARPYGLCPHRSRSREAIGSTVPTTRMPGRNSWELPSNRLSPNRPRETLVPTTADPETTRPCWMPRLGSGRSIASGRASQRLSAGDYAVAIPSTFALIFPSARWIRASHCFLSDSESTSPPITGTGTV